MSSADLRPGPPASIRIRPTDLGWVAAAVGMAASKVGSFAGLVGTLETVCWERSTDGTVRTQPDVIDANEGELPVGNDDVVASGCAGGQVSPLGSAIVVACVAGAAALAVGAGRRPRESTEAAPTG